MTGRAGDGILSDVQTDEASFVERALSGDRRAFDHLVEPYRRELGIHCYRMLGSAHDAEDLVQETLLRAWRGLRTYRGTAPVRAWLYKIATNACLNHLRSRPRIVVPTDALGGAPPESEIPWLEPYLDSPGPDPTEGALARDETSLAFLCAVQMLPALQRAVLILRDVLEFSAKETAILLNTSPAAVNSALQRARARLTPDLRREPPFAPRPPAPEEELLVRRFMRAWEARDIDGLVEMLAEDAILAMPPTPTWHRGPAAIGQFFATVPLEGRLDLIGLRRIRANGRPALAAYVPNEQTGEPEGYGIMVMDFSAGKVSRITGFPIPGLFGIYDLPAQPEAPAGLR